MGKQYWCGKCGFLRTAKKPDTCYLCKEKHCTPNPSLARRFFNWLRVEERIRGERSFNAMMERNIKACSYRGA